MEQVREIPKTGGGEKLKNNMTKINPQITKCYIALHSDAISPAHIYVHKGFMVLLHEGNPECYGTNYAVQKWFGYILKELFL